jgi:hypothetical protein
VAFVIQQSSCYNFFLFRDFSIYILSFVEGTSVKIFCAILLKPARQHLHHNIIFTVLGLCTTTIQENLGLSAGKYPTKTKHSIGLTHHLCHNQLCCPCFTCHREVLLSRVLTLSSLTTFFKTAFNFSNVSVEHICGLMTSFSF